MSLMPARDRAGRRHVRIARLGGLHRAEGLHLRGLEHAPSPDQLMDAPGEPLAQGRLVSRARRFAVLLAAGDGDRRHVAQT